MKKVSEIQSAGKNSCAVRSVRVSCSDDTNHLGERNYRTVYGVQEVATLYVDTEIINKQYGGEAWESGIICHLFSFDGKKAVVVAEKSGTLTLEKDEAIVRFGISFTEADLGGNTFREGIYRIVANLDGIEAQSDDLYFVEGDGQAANYFQAVHVGIDKSCKETEEESNARTHSFQEFDLAKTDDLRFYMFARNLLKKEWVYEFVVRVFRPDGWIKVERFVKSGQYVKDSEGNSLLCFAVELGGGVENFWTAGAYTLAVSAFDQPVAVLHFNIGDKEVPYTFDVEITGESAKRSLSGQTGYSAEGKDEVLDRLYRLVGLRKVKEEITRISEYAEFIRLRRENGFGDRFPQMHMIFTGHPGTGKNTVAEMIGELFNKLGILANGRVTHCGRKDLVQEGAAVEEQLVRKALTAAAGGVLFVDLAGDLFHPENPEDRGNVALNVLLGILMHENPDVLVILADDADEMDQMQNLIPELKNIFLRRLCFEDYTAEELMEITRNKLEKLQYRFTPAAEDKFFKLLKAACVSNEVDFTNGRFIDERLEEAALQLSRRVMAGDGRSKEDLMLLTDADIVVEPEMGPEKSLEKLSTIVGHADLKQDIVHHLNYVYFIRERQKHGFEDIMPPLNMIFSGNPGTGKLTVARMMGEIYHGIGLLPCPDVVVQNGQNLTGDGGMTPEQTLAVLADAADGGILYLEDADALTQTPFGLALFELLLASVPTDGNGDFIVILAGCPDRIQKMLGANPALTAYFPCRFEFNDYTAEELADIAEEKLKEKNYVIHPKAREVLCDLIRKVSEKRDKYFGNALWVDKLVDTVVWNLSERTMNIRKERELTRTEVTTVMVADIPVDAFKIPEPGRDVFDETEIGSALNDLDQVVGQPGIKKQIRDFVDLARHYSQQGIKLNSRMSLQWCFTGNSGMGKGTVARIIGRLYKAMGIVDKGHVLDFKVEKLIGQMEDEAQRNIGEALAKSAGGIFLFDEDSVKLSEAAGFKERVRALLMNQMAERPGAYMVIYAEPKESVPGFNGSAEHISEIVNVLVFEDYTKEELLVLLKRRLAKEKMQLTATARQHMVQFIGAMVSTEERSRASSRLMRIVADMIVRNCVQRIAKNGIPEQATEMVSVQKQDVSMFDEKFVAGLMKERKKIGYQF